jgi:hypothetical protein
MNAHQVIRLPDPPEHPLMTALSRGLPISLLIDLIDPAGPRSQEMFERESISADDEALVIPEAAHSRTA